MIDLPISSHLPDMVDQYISTRAQRLAADRLAASLKEAEDDMYKAIIAKYREQGLTALGGKLGVVKMKESIEPIAMDWPQVWAYIAEHEAWELLHKRITVTAVKERWDAGEEVPGVGRVTKYSLSVSGDKNG